jgi:predicted RNase H-like HicB family nuclease/DNA-binding Xre family transcriptional regulator
MATNETWLQNNLRKVSGRVGYETERLMIGINEEIVAQMDAQNVTRTELAERLDVDKAQVTRMLNGTSNMTLKTLVSVASALGCRVSVPALIRISQSKPKVIVPAYSMRVFWSDEDGVFIAVSPEFHGLSAFGGTYEDAVRELRTAIELAVQAMIEDGETLPQREPVDALRPQVRPQIGGERQQVADSADPARK